MSPSCSSEAPCAVSVAVAVLDLDVAERSFGIGHAVDAARDDLERFVDTCVVVIAFDDRLRRQVQRLRDEAKFLREGLRRRTEDEPEGDDRSSACGHELRLN